MKTTGTGPDSRADLIEIGGLLIGGSVMGGSGSALRSIDPRDGTVVGVTQDATAADIDQAVADALSAVRRGDWAARLPHQRARVLRRMADALRANTEGIARLQMRENGKTVAECRGQAETAAGIFDYFAALCETREDAVHPPRGSYLSISVQEPYGVVAAITPWNSPLTMTAQKLAPALAAGNAVVLKPSEVTPLVGLRMAQLCQVEGLPAGQLNVASGGAEAGRCLVAHPDVALVSFTGGTGAGRAIASQAAEKLMPVILELGGKSPNIVFADADLDAAVEGLAGGIFGGQGQSCVAGSRGFVQRAVFEQVAQRLSEHARNLRLGPPDDPQTQIGPMASFGHRDKVAEVVARGLDEGGSCQAGGFAPDTPPLSEGAYYHPTVITDLPSEATLCQEELFAPVICLLPFDDEDDLIAQANGTPYGLACGIWTSNFARAWRVARAIEAGTVWINTYKQLSVAAPFGGFKDSGLGREKGPPGLTAYQQFKSVYLGLSEGTER